MKTGKSLQDTGSLDVAILQTFGGCIDIASLKVAGRDAEGRSFQGGVNRKTTTSAFLDGGLEGRTGNRSHLT